MLDEMGTIYLLHFSQPYHHAKHYCGWTHNGKLAERLDDHRAGRGAKLMAVISEAGIDFEVAATWAGTRSDERHIKNRGGLARVCPICRQRKKGSQ